MQIPSVNSPLGYAFGPGNSYSNTSNPAVASGLPAAQDATTRQTTNAGSNEASGQNTQTSGDNRPSQNASRTSTELTEEQQHQVEQLKTTDREVRAHEAAHIAAAGGLARGGASFSYQTGPDGRRYAVGGEVSIDTSAVRGNPQATIQKAQTIRAAALAPANPSGPDRAVAAAAGQLEATARAELAASKNEEQQAITQGHTEKETGISEPQTTHTDTATIESTTAKPNTGIENYQGTSNPRAPSDLLGQLLNISA